MLTALLLVLAARIFESTTVNFFPCTRVPRCAVRLPGTNTVLAFAECRRWVGDQCCPVACCGPGASNTLCPRPANQPRCSGGCHPWGGASHGP
jgi:hypothetical protein